MPALADHIGAGQTRNCRNWGKMTEWATQSDRSACFKLDDYREATNTLEQFAFCPPGSPYQSVQQAYFDYHGHKDPYEVKDDEEVGDEIPDFVPPRPRTRVNKPKAEEAVAAAGSVGEALVAVPSGSVMLPGMAYAAENVKTESMNGEDGIDAAQATDREVKEAFALASSLSAARVDSSLGFAVGEAEAEEDDFLRELHAYSRHGQA